MAADRAHTVRAVAISVGVTLLVLELGARALTGSFTSWAPAPDVGAESTADPDLGYIPHRRTSCGMKLTTIRSGAMTGASRSARSTD